MILYYAEISDFNDEFFEDAEKVYPIEKKDSMINSKNEKAKKESVLAWKIVSHFCGDTNEISQNKHGKPYFRKNDVFFSISHSDGNVIVAVDNAEIGADIQKIKQPSDAVVRRVLTHREAALYEKQTDKALCFTKLWTFKESYTKFYGSSIAENLKTLDFSLYLNEEKFQSESLHYYTFRNQDFCVSVCGKNKIENIELKKVGQFDF